MTWANQTRILIENFKQLGVTIGETFINLLKPAVKALNVVIAKLQDFALAVSNSLGKIFGWQYEEGGGITQEFEDAEEITGGVSDNLGSAATNAKELKSHMLAIDELNVVEKDSGSSSGSGSGSGGSTGSGGTSGGKWVQTESMFKNYESELDTLYKLGDFIGTKLTDAMNNINWDSVYEGARNFGKGLADFLNGLISPELFGAVGKTIAGALNTAIYAALSYHETFDGYEFGVSISTAINNFFETFDFESLAETLNSWVDELEDIIVGAISTLDTEKITKGLKDFFTNLEIDTIAVIIGIITIKSVKKIVLGGSVGKYLALSLVGKIKNIVMGAITSVSAWLSGLSFTNIITGIISGLVGALAWINPGMIGELGIKLEKLFRGTFLDASTWTGLPKKIDDAVMGAIDSIGSFIGNTIIGLWETLKNAVSKIFNWNETTAIFDDAKENFKEGGLNIVLGIGEGIIGALSFLLEPLKNIFDWIWEGICDLFGIHSPADEMKPLGEYILLGVIEGFKNKISEFTKAMKEWWDRSVAPWFTKEKWLNTFDNIKKALKSKFTTIVSQWKSDISNWWNNHVAPWFTKEKWNNILSEIPSAFKRAFKNAINGAISLFNKFINFVNEKMHFSWDGIKIAGKQIVDSGSVQLFRIPTIPQFATGGVVTRPTLGMFGEDGAEAIVPLEKNTGWINSVAEQINIASSGGASDELLREQNELLRQQNSLLTKLASKDFDVKLDGRTLVNELKNREKRNGFSFA